MQNQILDQVKTAKLFSSGCEVAAILGGAPEHQQGLREFGYSVGMPFQIMDDILDYVGDSEIFCYLVMIGIKQVKPGGMLNDIGSKCQEVIARDDFLRLKYNLC